MLHLLECGQERGVDLVKAAAEAGKRANLLLVTKDPLKTVDAYDAIDTVFIGGKPIARKELSAKNAAR